MMRTADSHAECQLSRADVKVDDDRARKHFHEASYSPTADFDDVVLPTTNDDETVDLKPVTSVNNSDSAVSQHDKTSASLADEVTSLDTSHDTVNTALRDECSTAEAERGRTAEEDVVISAAEQCVDATVFGRHLVTASHINEQAPQFWHLHNGLLDVELTQNCDAVYKQSLTDQNITFGGRNHAQLFCFDRCLVYVRKRSTTITPCVIRISSSNLVSVLAHVHLPDSYFSVFLPETWSASGPFSMYVVRDGVLEQRSADMKLLRTIQLPKLTEDQLPKLTEDIPNMSSSAGKKKLLSYAVAVTEDRRYFVIACPTVGAKSGRYVDVVDLRANCYVQRVALDARLAWKVLHDGMYCLVRPAGSDSFELVKVRTVAEEGKTYEYCSITESDLQIRSPDGQFGVELTPDHSIHIWRTVSTPEKSAAVLERTVPTLEQTALTEEQKASTADLIAPTLEHSASAVHQKQSARVLEHCCVLRGHVAEVTCVSWSSTDSRLLVSGSRDNTVRLWSLVAGATSQLCLFHFLGTIDNVHFDSTSRYVVVHCSYAPQRKRAIILKVANA